MAKMINPTRALMLALIRAMGVDPAKVAQRDLEVIPAGDSFKIRWREIIFDDKGAVMDRNGLVRTDWFTRKFVRDSSGVVRFCNDHDTRGPHKCAMEVK